MDITSIPPTEIAWKTVAVQKAARLQEGGAGKTLKQMVSTIQPVLYTEGGKIEQRNLPSSRLNVQA